MSIRNKNREGAKQTYNTEASNWVCAVLSGIPEVYDWAQEVCVFCKQTFQKEETAKEMPWNMKKYGVLKKLKNGQYS